MKPWSKDKDYRCCFCLELLEKNYIQSHRWPHSGALSLDPTYEEYGSHHEIEEKITCLIGMSRYWKFYEAEE